MKVYYIKISTYAYAISMVATERSSTPSIDRLCRDGTGQIPHDSHIKCFKTHIKQPAKPKTHGHCCYNSRSIPSSNKVANIPIQPYGKYVCATAFHRKMKNEYTPMVAHPY